MSLASLLVLLVIAGICGAVGQAIAGYDRGGLLAAIGLGFIGALVGWLLARSVGLPELLPLNVGGTRFPVVWSMIGATLFVLVLGLINRRRATVY